MISAERISEIAEAWDATLQARDPELLGSFLHPQCSWGDCADAETVLREMHAILRAGVTVEAWSTEQLPDRVVSTVSGRLADDDPTQVVFALLIADGTIRHIFFTSDITEARSVLPQLPQPGAGSASPDHPLMQSMAAVLPCRDLQAAMSHYELLGFSTRGYDDSYGYAERDEVALHLAAHGELDPLTNTSAVFLFVDDADALYEHWRASGAGGRFPAPENTPYGMREGAHVDPDGNLLRYGSRI